MNVWALLMELCPLTAVSFAPVIPGLLNRSGERLRDRSRAKLGRSVFLAILRGAGLLLGYRAANYYEIDSKLLILLIL